jgi:polysaccharide pyruvyl transferase WcaK-like protein
MFAARQNVPFVSLPYASKIAGFIEELELPTPPLDNLNAGTLLAHIDRSWDTQKTLRNRIARNLPALVARAKENHAILREILQGQEVGDARPRSTAGA